MGNQAPVRYSQLHLPSVDLSAAEPTDLPRRERRVYVNRNLRLDQIEWVGFDMDYTLAIYDQAEMDRLSIDATVEKLVAMGYPESMRELSVPLDFPVRGLMIDHKLGNVLKMDRYKYVKRAYHGMRELSTEERRALYHSRRVRSGSPRYHWIDTLYGLSEVTLYAGAVSHLESLDHRVDYEQLFADIRACIDRSHQDGSILDHIQADPERYLQRDPQLPATLHKLRSAGKKLFLLTNSHADYTRRIMSYLLDGALPEYPTFMQYFDVAVCAARKPDWFTRDTPFERIERDGSQVFAGKLERGALYTGGCLDELERLIGTGGDSILYVGDHIYGDVLRAKKHSAWRTTMIIQELEQELTALVDTHDEHERWDDLEEMRTSMVEELRMRQAMLKELSSLPPSPQGEAKRLRLRRSIERVRSRLRAVESECNDIESEIERQFHPFWGPLLKAGAEASSFGYQVATYACLYTGRVSNLLSYSTLHYFRGPRDRMPHES